MKIARKIGTDVGEKRPGLCVHAVHALHGEQAAVAQHDSKANANATHAGAVASRIAREAWRFNTVGRWAGAAEPATPNNGLAVQRNRTPVLKCNQ